MRLCVTHSVLSPTDPSAALSAARAWGFDGILLIGAHGHLDLAAGGAWVRRAGREKDGAVLAGLHAGVSFQGGLGEGAEGERSRVLAAIRAASDLGAELVVLSAGRHRGLRVRAMQENAEILSELAVEAAERHVRLAYENAGDLPGTVDLWHVCDAAGHPAVRACLNLGAAQRAGETVSLAAPRLAGMLSVVHLADARVDTGGGLSLGGVPFELLDVPRLIDVLKGLVFRGWLLVSPAAELDEASRAAAERAAAERLRAELAKPVVELSAYKGDKNAPRFAKPAAAAGP